MKWIYSLILCTLISCSHAQNADKATTKQEAVKFYEIVKEGGEHNLRGIIPAGLFDADTVTYAWYNQNGRYFKPAPETVEAVKAQKGKGHILIAIGSWCHDSQSLYPQYIKLLKEAGWPDDALTILALDRNKTTIGSLEKVLNITHVPTLIFIKNGKEAGRIVEYGETALVNTEMKNLMDKAK